MVSLHVRLILRALLSCGKEALETSENASKICPTSSAMLKTLFAAAAMMEGEELQMMIDFGSELMGVFVRLEEVENRRPTRRVLNAD